MMNWSVRWNFPVQAVDALYLLLGCLLKLVGGQALKQITRYRLVCPCLSIFVLPSTSRQDQDPRINLHWKDRLTA